jgi:hypothetical protein
MRLVRMVGILWLSLLALSGSAVFYGRARSEQNELQALGFSICHDRLCFMGIKPGVTPPQNAEKMLIEHGAIKIPASARSYLVGPNRAQFSADDSVASISFEPQSEKLLPLTVGHVLNYLGNPCRFDRGTFSYGYTIVLIYPFGYLMAISDNPIQLNVATPLSYIFIYPPFASPDECERGLPWPGLRRIR